MNENTNKIATSGVNNILSGLGIFILGIPLAVFLIGPGLMSDFGPGETWIKRALMMSGIVIVGYGLLGYALGKIKPTMSWKSGFLLALFTILSSVFAIVTIIIDSPYTKSGGRNIDLSSLPLFVPVITAIIIGPLSSYFGSRSKKTWQGKFLKIVLTIIILIALFLVGSFFIRLLTSSPASITPTTVDELEPSL